MESIVNIIVSYMPHTAFISIVKIPILKIG